MFVKGQESLKDLSIKLSGYNLLNLGKEFLWRCTTSLKSRVDSSEMTAGSMDTGEVTIEFLDDGCITEQSLGDSSFGVSLSSNN